MLSLKEEVYKVFQSTLILQFTVICPIPFASLNIANTLADIDRYFKGHTSAAIFSYITQCQAAEASIDTNVTVGCNNDTSVPIWYIRMETCVLNAK